MKFIFGILLLSTLTWANEAPVLVPVPLDRAFIPFGFDDNDRAQLVVEGTLPNACFKAGPYKTEIDEEKKVVTIRQSAYVYGGYFCLQVMVPYDLTIELGLLKQGSYSVKDGANGHVLGSLSTKASTTSAPDDYLYASVSEARILKESDGTYIAELEGTFTDSCLKVKEVRVEYQPNVLVILPVAQREPGGETECESGSFPFAVRQLLEKEKLTGPFLMHVRVMNGKAINRLVD